MNVFQDVEFWERAWEEDRKRCLAGRWRQELKQGDHWNRRAESFHQHTGGEEARRRAAGVLHLVGHHGGLEKDAWVLDIGAGPGHYAVPIARRVGKVIGLDPSEAMLTILVEAAEKEGVGNVEPVKSTWEQVDLAENGWEQRFDLVLAIMSPGISDPESLAKMVRASRGYCLLEGHLDRRATGRKQLWQEIIGGEMPPTGQDSLYIFNLLYAWGYRPSLDFEERRTITSLARDEAVAELENFLYPYAEITPKISAIVAGYVDSHLVEGIFLEERHSTVATLFWRVTNGE